MNDHDKCESSTAEASDSAEPNTKGHQEGGSVAHQENRSEKAQELLKMNDVDEIESLELSVIGKCGDLVHFPSVRCFQQELN